MKLLKNHILLQKKNLGRLFRGSKYDKGLYYCKKCYFSFKSKEKLEKIHIPLCTDNKNVLTITSKKIYMIS